MPLVARSIPRISTNTADQPTTDTNHLMATSPTTNNHQQPPQQQQQDPNRKLSCPSPPPIIKDKRSEATYARKGLLGEGGFARCYEIEDREGKRYAAKVVPKTTLKLQKNKNKLFAEIKIHQSMRHNNIVKFHFCFEDSANVYMVLELCESKTMMDMLKRRRRFTEPEVRYYMLQILDACRYMHGNRIIHRDLKLGNLFLTADMEVRIGDFGLAAIIRHDGDRKKTICGTPNYIAPEILFDTQNGHSYEVDVWSLGVIMYTLLVGRPPFQTKDVKAIYRRIKENNYEFPSNIALSLQAKSLIQALLSTRPETRPSVASIIDHPFFLSGHIPPCIPPSALHTEPVFAFPTPIPSLSASLPAPIVANAVSATAINGRIRRPLTEMGVPPPIASPVPRNQYQTRYQRQQQQLQSQIPSFQLQPQQEHPHQQSHFQQQQHQAIRRKPSEDMRNNFSDMNKDLKQAQQRRQIETDVHNLEIPHNPSPINYTTLQPTAIPVVTRNRFVSSVRGATSSPTNNPRPAVPANDGTRSPLSRSTIGPLGPTMGGPGTGTAPVPARHPLASSTTGHPLSSTIGVGGLRTGETVGFGDRDGMDFRPNFAASTASAVGAPMQVRNNPTAAPTWNSENGTAGSPSPTSPHPLGAAKTGSLGVLEAMLRNLTIGFEECRERGEGGELDFEGERFVRGGGKEYHAPKIFICKWIDYSNKYGLGYQLTDGSVGVYFNDSTSIILSPDDHHFEYLYYARDGDRTLMHRRAYVLTEYPSELTKKVTLLKHFRGYMTENLFKASTYTFTDRSNISDLNFLTKYLRTKHAVVFRLSNRVVQINFFDHTKVVLAHDAELVTYINRNREIFTSSLSRILSGSGEAVSRIRYAKDVLEQLILKRAKKAAAGSRKSSELLEMGKRGDGT